MMLLLLLRVELRSMIRAAVPRRAMRVALAVAGAAWVVLGSVGMLVAARQTPAGMKPGQAIAVAALLLGSTLAAGLAAASRSQRDSDSPSPQQLAPVSAAVVALAPCGAVAVLALILSMGLVAPLVVLEAFRQPLMAVLIGVIALAAAAWAAIIVLFVLATIRLRRGYSSAVAFGSALPAPLIVVTIGVVRWIAGQSIDVRLPVAIAGAAAALTIAIPAIHHASQLWVRSLSGPVVVRSSPPVTWGAPGWARMIGRTQMPWATVGLIPVVMLSSGGTGPLLVLLTVILPMAAMFHLVRWDDTRPDRLALSPFGRRVRFGLWTRVGLPCSITASGIATALLAREPSSAVIVVAAVWIGPLLFLLTNRTVRNVLQGLVLLAAASQIAFAG